VFKKCQLEIAQTNVQDFPEFMRNTFNFSIVFKELENSFYTYYKRIKEKTIADYFSSRHEYYVN